MRHAVPALAILGLGLAAAAIPATAHAQRWQGDHGYGHGRGQVFRCESDNDRRRHCDVDTRGGVQLVQQLSRSPCIEGRTWGRDRGGVWVDNGCRGEFAVGGGGGHGRPGGGQGFTSPPFRCESKRGRTSECPVDVRGRAHLVRQLSDAPCIEGRNWGQDGRGVWVTGGCRGEFQVEGRSWSRWR